MSDLLNDLQAKRKEIRAGADDLVTRAADEARDLTGDELSQWKDLVGEEREINERIEQYRDDQVREARAAIVRGPQGAEENALGNWLLRNITGGDSSAGSAFTPADASSTFFDRLAAQSIFLQSGVRVVSTARDSVQFPRWSADTDVGWVSEGSAITSTSGTADTVTATPMKLAGLETISNEVLADSSPSIFEVIGSGLVRNVALKADLGFFEGSGTPPEIRGLLNTTGAQMVNATTGAITNLDDVADLISALEAENANASAIAMHPELWKLYLKLKEGTSNNNKPVLQDSAGSGAQGVTRAVYGIPVFLSSQLRTDGAYCYDVSQQVVVRRQDVSVELDRSRLFNYDSSEIRAVARIDFVSPNPKSIAMFGGVTV